MDRRAIFFLVATGVCMLMSLVIDAELRYVPYALAVTYAVLCVLSVLDSISRHGDVRRRR